MDEQSEVLALQSAVRPPWRSVTGDEAAGLRAGLKERYPDRDLVPFARRDDWYDVACVVLYDSVQPAGEIIAIHDFASPGWEVLARLPSVEAWHEYSVEDQAEWSSDG